MIIGAALCLCALLPLRAQTAFQEGFYLNDYQLTYRYNPAFQNASDFVSVGQFSRSGRSNVGEKSKLYLYNGEVVTGFHPSVSAEEYLSNLQPDNYKFSVLDYNVFSYGKRRGDNYHTFEVNLRGMYYYSVPIEVFSFVKKGTVGSPFDLSETRASGKLSAETAYGFSRQLNKTVSVGIRPKLLVGLNAGTYRIDKLNLTMNQQEYTADIEATLDLTNRSKNLVPGEEGYLSPFRNSKRGAWGLPSAVGAAFDFGIVIRPWEDLTIAASLLDLGTMVWHYGNAATSSGSASFTGLQEATMDELGREGLITLMKDVLNDYGNTLRLRKTDKVNKWEVLPFQANAAIKYTMPFYRGLSIGITASYMDYDSMPYWDVRAGFGLHPMKPFRWLDFTANIGKDTYGPVYGWGMTFHVTRFHLSVGKENGIGPVVPYGGKLNPNRSYNTFGLTVDL